MIKTRSTIAVGSALSMLMMAGCNSDGQSSADGELQFAVWTYNLEGVQGVLDDFAAYNAAEDPDAPPVDVTLTEAGFGEYNTRIASLNTAGQQLDVLYGSDHWLAQWAESGWILPIDEHCPDLVQDFDQASDFSKDGLTYEGSVYGMPYYSDVMYFVYNASMLEEAGIDAPPSTWEELAEQAAIIKNEGIAETPVRFGMSIDSWLEEQLFALLYSRGGELFDDDFNATFSTDSGPLYDTVQWLRDAVDEGIMPQNVVELDIQDVQLSFMQGETAFTLLAGYMLADLGSAESAVAGDYVVAMIPGSTQTTAGFTRSYSLGSGAVDGEGTLETACRFLEYHGGFTSPDGSDEAPVVAKWWAVENGLGFSYESLWDDADVRNVMGQFADIDVLQEQKVQAQSKEGMSAPWYAEWISAVRPEVQAVLMGDRSTEEALERIKTQWQELAAE